MTVQQWASIEAETILDAFAKEDGADDLVCLHLPPFITPELRK